MRQRCRISDAIERCSWPVLEKVFGLDKIPSLGTIQWIVLRDQKLFIVEWYTNGVRVVRQNVSGKE